MDLKQIKEAIKIIADEKGLTIEEIQETLNTALAAAYRKDFGEKNQNIVFNLDLENGDMSVHDEKIVVDFDEEILSEIRENGIDKKYVQGMVIGEESEENQGREDRNKRHEVKEEEIDGEERLRYNPKTDILLEEAKKIKKSHKIGDVVITPLEIHSDFGRMAAQTAKQVIIQKIREAERENVFSEFEDKTDQLLNAFVARLDGRNILIDLGKINGIMPPEEQVRNERYNVGDRIKVYVLSVEKTLKGPQIIVSRAHPKIIAKLFATEIPEIEDGSIEIKSIAREAGFRTKIAVYTQDDNIDPIGSCVGQRGSRIQTIIAELGGEKIDIIEYENDPVKFIANSLSPAKVSDIKITKEPKEHESGEATVTVPEDQLSLAIGKEGQNVRLAAKLTGWKINILKEGEGKIVTSSDKEVLASDEIDSEISSTEIEKDLDKKAGTQVNEDNELLEIKNESDIDDEKLEEAKMQDQDPAEAEVIDEPQEATEDIKGDQPKN